MLFHTHTYLDVVYMYNVSMQKMYLMTTSRVNYLIIYLVLVLITTTNIRSKD